MPSTGPRTLLLGSDTGGTYTDAVVYDEQGSTVVVVSKGDEQLVNFAGITGWHFPRSANGQYAGHHPADSDAARPNAEATVIDRLAKPTCLPRSR